MFALVLICAGWLASDPPASEDRRAYEAASARAGRSAEAHVKLALWCEAHGMATERLKHLATAVLIDPANARARGLMGLVAYQKRWLLPAAVGDAVETDEALTAKLAEYNRRRAELEESLQPGYYGINRRKAARGHERLAMWCADHGLQAESVAHFTTAIHFDPYHDATWRRLGYVRHDGRWMTHDQIAASEREAHLQRMADRRWDTSLTLWKKWLGDRHKAPAARKNLASVQDPRAVPAIVKVFAHGPAADRLEAITLLRPIDAPTASRALANLAISSADAQVRETAIDALKERPLRDFVGPLIEMIHAPVTYRFIPVNGPGTTGGLEVDTPRMHLIRRYDAPPVVKLGTAFSGYIGRDMFGMPFIATGFEMWEIEGSKLHQLADIRAVEARTAELILEANIKAEVARQRLAADVDAIERFNAQAAFLRVRVPAVLAAVAGAPDLGEDEDAWHCWWYDRIGYRYDPPPRVTIEQDAVPQVPPPTLISCFVAGTPVRTLQGPRPIESIRVGDQVLCQDTFTGALDFQPVLVAYHNPPGATVRITLDGGKPLVPSVYHRFWRAGRGWAMARELKPGDILRTLDGLVRVESVEPAEKAPLFNLDVAGARTFFAGESALLVHDNSPPDTSATPFDAAAIEPPSPERR